MEQHKTVLSKGRSLLIEKKSRFLGFALPLSDSAHAEEWLVDLRKTYPDANHVVFAYRFLLPEQYSRYSDDGEPKGTAGPPLLDVLIGRELYQCGVAVVRYFGGSLLGTGGLVRAYGKTASEAIQAASLVTKTKVKRLDVTLSYDINERVQNGLRRAGYYLSDLRYAADVRFVALVPPVHMNDFSALLNDLSAGRALITPIGTGYLTSHKDDTI